MTATTVPNLDAFLSALGEYSFSFKINDVDHRRIAELLKEVPRMFEWLPPTPMHFADGGDDDHRMCDAMNHWVYHTGRSRKPEEGFTSPSGTTVQTMLIYMFWTDMEFQKEVIANKTLPKNVAGQAIGVRALNMFREGSQGSRGYWFLTQIRNWFGTQSKMGYKWNESH